MARAARPVSPHLQINRWYLTMALSIAHRVTGAALTFGLVLLTFWLLALAGGEDSFSTMRSIMDNPFGWLVMIGLTLALFFHTANGIRHLVWDAGYGFDKETARSSGMIVILVAAVLTLITWISVVIAA